jgi:YD repeat-containing protein
LLDVLTGFQFSGIRTMSSPSDASGCYGLSWSYDRYGNRLNQSTTSGSCFNSNHGILPNNRIADTGFSYDAAGNMTSDNAHTYTYDAESRLTKVDGGNTATYIYDAEGRRVEKTTSAGKIDYVYDLAGNVITEWYTGIGGRVAEVPLVFAFDFELVF